MEKLTQEDIEIENFIRLQSQQAMQWQKTVTADEDLDKWVSDGNLEFLKRRVFAEIERDALLLIKSPQYDPANLSQGHQIKALCQVIDLLTAKIESRVYQVRDARTKLNDLQHSTQTKEGE